MMENLFSYLVSALAGNIFFAVFAAFAWGVLSVLLSPCHLSSIPLIIGYVSKQGKLQAKQSILLSTTFAVGILFSIALIGIITALMGRLIGDIGSWANWLVGLVFIIFGLFLMDIIPLNWNLVNPTTNKRSGFWGALILGLIFGIGLGPCTFAFLAPVLGVVFQTASQNWTLGILLISAFAIGHCSIIIFAGSLTSVVQKYLDWSGSSNTLLIIKKIAGFFVLIGGIYFIYMIFN